nr:L321 [uncultured bacterium]
MRLAEAERFSLVLAQHSPELTEHTTPRPPMRNRLCRGLCGVKLHLRTATGRADLYVLVENYAHLFTLIEQVRVYVPAFSADPERSVEVIGIGVDDEVADGHVPVLVHEIDKVVNGLRAILVRQNLLDFRLPGEECRVGSSKLVSHLDGEAYRPDSGYGLFDGVVGPPTLVTISTAFAVECDPTCSSRLGELNGVVSATRGAPGGSKKDLWQPTPDVKISFVGANRHGFHLDPVFYDGRLILGGGRLRRGRRAASVRLRSTRGLCFTRRRGLSSPGWSWLRLGPRNSWDLRQLRRGCLKADACEGQKY